MIVNGTKASWCVILMAEMGWNYPGYKLKGKWVGTGVESPEKLEKQIVFLVIIRFGGKRIYLLYIQFFSPKFRSLDYKISSIYWSLAHLSLSDFVVVRGDDTLGYASSFHLAAYGSQTTYAAAAVMNNFDRCFTISIYFLHL